MVAVTRAKFVLDGNGEPIMALPCGVNGQTIAIGAASVQSGAAFDTTAGQETRVIRIAATGNCHYRVGSNPTAVATDPFLPANVVEYLTVNKGDRIAVIQDAASTGNLYVSEVS